MGKLYAANRIVSDDSTITNGVVEIENAVVKRVFELEKEIATDRLACSRSASSCYRRFFS